MMPEWMARAAIVLVENDEILLEEIFATDPELAFEWTLARLRADDYSLPLHHTGIAAAAKVLTRSHRIELLKHFSRRNFEVKAFDWILGEDSSLFAVWMSVQKDEYLRLRP